MLTRTGRKHARAVIIIFEEKEWPNQIMMSGAIIMVGMTFNETRYGMNASLSIFTWLNNIDKINAQKEPIKNPVTVSKKVIRKLLKRYAGFKKNSFAMLLGRGRI
jgi:hypothetical protein